MKTGETAEGDLVNVSETALDLSRKDSPVEPERGQIRRVYRVGGKSAGKAALIGLGLGAGAGAAIGAVVGAVAGLVAGLSGRNKELIYESE